MSQTEDIGPGGRLNSPLPEEEGATKKNDAGNATGEKRGELLATMGPPCTAIGGEKLAEFFASAAKNSK